MGDRCCENGNVQDGIKEELQRDGWTWGVELTARSDKRPLECFQVVSSPCHLHLLSLRGMWSFWSVHPMFSTNWRSMSVYMYIFAQMSSWVISMCPCVSVWRLIVCMYVCVCTCHRAPSASCSSAAECCVLSLLSCCRRNSAAAAPLPHFLFSLPLPWLTTWPSFILRHHLPPPAGCWQPCSRRIKMAHMRTNGGRRGSVLWNDVALESEEHHHTLQYIIW